ncbi:hypothetical protein Tco_0797594 [Tanacetum coccineum]
MKGVDHLTIHTPPLPHVASFHLKDLYCYYHPCIDDPKKHYGFKPGLLGQSGSLGVDFSNIEMIENDWELESKEVIFDEKKLGSSYEVSLDDLAGRFNHLLKTHLSTRDFELLDEHILPVPGHKHLSKRLYGVFNLLILPQNVESVDAQIGLAVPVFNQGDDPIAYLNKAMSYAGIGNKGNSTTLGANNACGLARVVKCYNYQGEGHMASQCTQPKRPRNVAWFKEKAMLAKAQESSQILDEEQLAFLAVPGISDYHDVQPTIIHNATFLTDDLDAYDSDCDDISSAKVVLMANLSNYGSDVLSKVPNFETYQNDMDNQSVQAMQHFEQTPIDDYPDNQITSDSNIIIYSQYLQETQQAAVQDTNLFVQQDSMILSVIEQMSEQMINHCSVDKQCFEIHKKEIFLENDRLLHQIMSQDVMLCVMNSIAIFGDSVNLEMKKSESCNTCLDLEAELVKKKNMVERDVYTELSNKFARLEKHCISLELDIQLNQQIFQKDKSSEDQNAPEFSE